MNPGIFVRLTATLALCGIAASQVPDNPVWTAPPIPRADPEHGLAGQRPGTEQWLVQFKTRSFDLGEFRNAIYAGRPAVEVDAIVRKLVARVRADQAPFKEAVEGLGGRVLDQWWIVNACAIEIPFAQLPAVRRLANVLRVEPNQEAYPLIKTATNAANHNSDAANAAGHKGKGIATAIVDTGLDSKSGNNNRPHRTFFEEGNLSRRNRLLANKQMGRLPADNSHPHGTGVAGIAAGGNWGTSAADNGHAPLADIVGYSLSNSSSGSTDFATLVRAWQAVAADAATFKIKTANNSYSGSSDPLNTSQQALDSAALNADVMIVVAAGNFSSSTRFSQSCANGLAAAAVNPTVHTVASFSSRGPLSGSQRFYPDIAGCGVNTIMPRIDNESTNWTASGTSMASPQVCGAATLVRAANPAVKADETKAILLATALDISRKNQNPPFNSRNAYGMGLVKDDSAVTLALNSAGHGRASVTTSSKTWQKVFVVQAGRTYRAAISWMRQTVTTKTWSNLDLDVLVGSTVVASSKTPRNLYEVAVFRATRSGAVTVRATGVTIEKGNQPFGWAFTEGSGPPVESDYRVFGIGCAGASQGCKPCFGRNWTKTLAGKTTTAQKIGVLEFGRGTTNACGIDLYTAARTSAVNVTVSIMDLDNNTAQPGKVLRSAVVRVGTSPGIYSARFSSAVRLAKNSLWVVVFDNADKLSLPVSKTGTDAPHYEFNGSTWSSLLAGAFWEYQVACDRGSQAPVLSNTGKPVLGKTLTLNLSAARNNSAALLFIGGSDKKWGALPLPLTFAPGCQLLVSGEAILGMAVNSTGTASVPIAIPNAKDLINVIFFNQFLVKDPANRLGMVASNAGRGRIGEF